MTDEERLSANIPANLHYLAKKNDRTITDIVTSGIERELNVEADDSIAVLKHQEKRTADRLKEVQDEMRDLSEEAGRLKDDLDRIRELIDTRQDENGDYEAHIDALLDDMELDEVAHVDPNHARITDIRGEFDRSPAEIHYDLKARAAEQGRDLTNTRFMEFRRAKSVRRRGDVEPIAESWGGEGE